MQNTYLNLLNHSDYFVDKIAITYVINTISSDDFIEFNQPSSSVRFINEDKTFKIVKSKAGFITISKYKCFNGNEIARNYLEKKFELLWPTLSKSLFTHQKNFIPPGIRRLLENEGLEIAKLRKRIIKRLWREIDKEAYAVLDVVKKITKKNIRRRDIRTYINNVEVNWDLITESNTNIATEKGLYEGFNNLSNKSKSGFFKDGKLHACRHENLSIIDEKDNKPYLQFYISTNKAKIIAKVYQKADGQYGSLNRIEFQFHKKSLSKLVRSRNFNHELDLSDLISILSDYAFGILSDALKGKKKSNSFKKNLKYALMTTFSGKTWYPLWKYLNTTSIVSTKTGCAIPKSCKILIPKYCKQNVIFKKVGAGTYKVDEDLLTQFEHHFANFKINQKVNI